MVNDRAGAEGVVEHVSRPNSRGSRNATAEALIAWLAMRGPAGTNDAQLTVSNRVTYSGVVHDDATRSTIVSALGATFGEGNLDGNLRVDRQVRPASWLPSIGDLSSALKTPGAELSLDGDDIKLGGWLSRQCHESRGDNFATGSAEISSDSMEVIKESADALRRAPAGARVEIGGHTDNTGNPASNLTLSQTRADAVKAALVSAGVPSDRLETKGYGDTKPRATNETEYGRFQNRRIEYTVVRSWSSPQPLSCPGQAVSVNWRFYLTRIRAPDPR